jgi:urease accessory protein
MTVDLPQEADIDASPHVAAVTVPWVEPAIALTIAVAAGVIGMRARPPAGLLAALFVVAGALHGYAYGESIVGAETSPLAAYIAGFGVIQYVVAVGSGAALRAIIERRYLGETKALRLAGGGLALLAILAFVNVAMAG